MTENGGTINLSFKWALFAALCSVILIAGGIKRTGVKLGPVLKGQKR